MTPTTYIVSQDCKSATAKAQMAEPKHYQRWKNNKKGTWSNWGINICMKWEEHLRSLPIIHLDPSLQGKFQPGDEIEEGRDFVLGQKGSYNDTDGVVHEPSNTAYPLTDAGEGKRVCKYCGVATNMPEGECYKAPLPQSSKPEATGSGEKMKVVFDKEDKICSCGVPDGIHNTCCGWENANVVLFPFDNEITGAVSSYEKALRWKCRNNPDCAEFAVRTLRTYPHLSFSPQSPSASPVGVEELAKEYANREHPLKQYYDSSRSRGFHESNHNSAVAAFLAGHTAAHRGKGVEEDINSLKTNGERIESNKETPVSEGIYMTKDSAGNESPQWWNGKYWSSTTGHPVQYWYKKEEPTDREIENLNQQ